MLTFDCTETQDKQAENVVEKLCQRFRNAEGERAWRDISLCLSLLPYKSEKSFKKLLEGMPNYQDKVHEEVVYKNFTDIVAKVCNCLSTLEGEDCFFKQLACIAYCLNSFLGSSAKIPET